MFLHPVIFKLQPMAKRKLTAKLKQQIKESPYRLRQADFAGDALKYLHRVRGARKAAKTKIIKQKYKAPKRPSEKAPVQVSDLVDMAARAKGITTKKFRKLYPKEVADFERDMTLKYSRDSELLKNDIRFLPEGRKVFNQGKRVKREQMQYLITRLYNKMQQSEIAERIPIEHFYDGEGNLHINIPTPDEYADLEGDELLEYIDENYPDITYFRSSNKNKK